MPSIISKLEKSPKAICVHARRYNTADGTRALKSTMQTHLPAVRCRESRRFATVPRVSKSSKRRSPRPHRSVSCWFTRRRSKTAKHGGIFLRRPACPEKGSVFIRSTLTQALRPSRANLSGASQTRTGSLYFLCVCVRDTSHMFT